MIAIFDNDVWQGKRAGTGYTKQCTLTPELAAVVGQDQMARHEVVKKVWSIIKEKNLYVSLLYNKLLVLK